jgi:hypothetical protein
MKKLNQEARDAVHESVCIDLRGKKTVDPDTGDVLDAYRGGIRTGVQVNAASRAKRLGESLAYQHIRLEAVGKAHAVTFANYRELADFFECLGDER